MKFSQLVETVAIVFRNVILGGNVVSLLLLRSPRRMVGYVSENLFLYRTLCSKRGIPQRNVYEILPAKNIETIRLGNLESGGTWFWPSSSYGADLCTGQKIGCLRF